MTADPAVDRAGPPAVQGATHKDHPDGGFLTGDHATGDWFGLRPTLVERGITLEAFLVADLSQNLRGGIDTESEAFRHLLDVGITFDSGPLLGFAGGKAYADFQTQNGRNGTDLLVGDVQGFSNIDADGFTALFELWYEQILLDGRVRVKVGKVEVANEFAFVDNGAEFIHSSPGADPAIVGYPTYPDPATSVNVFVYPVEGLYAGFGVYDGATQDGIPTGTHGPKTFLGSPSDLFLIAETGVGWTGGADGLAGRVGVGLSHHTGTFDVLDEPGETEDGATSVFLVLDQTLIRERPDRENDPQGVAAFVQIAATEGDVAEVDRHVGVGVVWAGAMPGRDDDATGVMASYVHLSDAARDAGTFTEDFELAVECFYKAQVTPWVSVKPDVQYIVNPGAAGARDAVVATIRLELAL